MFCQKAYKKRIQRRCFPVNIAKFSEYLRTTISVIIPFYELLSQYLVKIKDGSMVSIFLSASETVQKDLTLSFSNVFTPSAIPNMPQSSFISSLPTL